MTDTKMSAGVEGSFEFRCGARRWKIHAITQSRLDPIIGISVYIIDVYTHGKVDEEWLHGRNAKLCKGRAVLADNLVLAAVPLRCRASASAFRIRMEAIERIMAPGEIGSCRAAELEDPGDGRGDWIDVSATRPVAATPSCERAREWRPLVVQDRDPTPPPLLLGDGIIYCNSLEPSAIREAAFDEQTTVRLQGLVPTLRSKGVIDLGALDAGISNPRTGDTLRIDQSAYRWQLSAAARASGSDDTQLLRLDALEDVLGAAPMVRVRGEPTRDVAGSVARTQVTIRARR